jgi:hypothetical protein
VTVTPNLLQQENNMFSPALWSKIFVKFFILTLYTVAKASPSINNKKNVLKHCYLLSNGKESNSIFQLIYSISKKNTRFSS